MRLHGWCEKCRKIKRVTVSPRTLGKGGVPTGICADCEDEERKLSRQSG